MSDPAANAPANIRFINPPDLGPTPGYTHVVVVSGGSVVYIAGQVPLDSSGQPVGPGDFVAQAHQVFQNLQIALAAVGADFNQVVKLNYYLTDMETQLLPLREVRNQYINTASPPASTAVEVRRLFREDVLLEIEAVAALPI